MRAIELKFKRQNAGINRQVQLAKLVGCHQTTLVDIERGRIGIDQETYDRICAAIDDYAAKRKEVAA